MSGLATQIEMGGEAANSRFFVPHNQGHCLSDLQANIQFTTDRIRELARCEGMAGALSLGVTVLLEQVESFENEMQRVSEKPGDFRVTFPKRFTFYTSAYDPLVDHYLAEDDGEIYTVKFPTSALDVCRALPYLAAEGHIHNPAVNVRIKTESDEPTKVFDRGGAGIIEVPSNGRWYHFPLRSAGIDYEER